MDEHLSFYSNHSSRQILLLIYISERLQLRTAYQLMNRVFQLYPLTMTTYRNSRTLDLRCFFSKFMKKKQYNRDNKKHYSNNASNSTPSAHDQELHRKKKYNNHSPNKSNSFASKHLSEEEGSNALSNGNEKFPEDRVNANTINFKVPEEYAHLFSENWIKKTDQVLLKDGYSIVDQLNKMFRTDAQDKDRKQFNFLRNLIPKLGVHKIELPYQSFETCFRKVYFCPYLNYMGTSADIDYQTIVFFNNNASRICQIIQKNKKIEEILTFYSFFMQLFNNRTHMTITKANLSQIISSLFSKISQWCDLNKITDPHSLYIMKLFADIVSNKRVREEQLRFVNSLCSQIPFLDMLSFKVFMLHLTKFFAYTDEGITRSVLELIKMDHLKIISGLKQEEYLPFVQGLKSIVNDRPQIVVQVEEIYEMMLKQVFQQMGKEGNIKYSMNMVCEFLVELSNRLNFSKIDKTLSYKLFQYLKSIIGKDMKDAQMNALNFNRLFELLKIMVINSALDPVYFNSELRMLQKTAYSLANKYSSLKKSYLLTFLRAPSNIYSQQLPISFKNAHNVEQSTFIILKFMDKYIKEENIVGINELFLLMLNKDNECSFSKIKKNEGELQMQQILHRINNVLVKTENLDCYKGIFFEILQLHEQSGKFILLFLDNLNKIPKIDKAQVLNCYFQASLRKMKIMLNLYKPIINNQIMIIEHYITIGQKDLLLQIPNFYNVVGRMLHYINKTIYLNETYINIYKLVQFVLENDQNGKIINSIFYGLVKNFVISEEAASNLSKYIDVNEFQGVLLRYKVNTLLQSQDLDNVYDLVFVKKTVYASEIHKMAIQKRYFKDFKFEMSPNPQNLFLFFYDRDMEILLNKHNSVVFEIIKNYNEIELAKCLYRFYTDEKTIKTVYFKKIWSEFLKKLSRPDLYLSMHILIKVSTIKIDQQQLKKYLMFLLEYFSAHLDRLPQYHIRKLSKFIIDIAGDQQYNKTIRNFLQSVKNYAFSNKFYITLNEKYDIIKYALMAGQRISFAQMWMIKNLMFQDINCYLIIYHHEDVFTAEQMETLLKEYRAYRRRSLTINRRQQMSQFQSYNEMKYPLIFTHDIPQVQQMKSLDKFDISQKGNRSVQTLKDFVNKYEGVSYDEKYRVAITKNHAIAFCEFSYKLYYDFLVKLFNLLPETKNLEILICNSAEKTEDIQAFLEENNILIPNQSTFKQRELSQHNNFKKQNQ